MLERTSRPRFRALILDRAGVTLDPDLAAELARLTRRFADDIFTLVDSLDPGPPELYARPAGPRARCASPR
jgi:hypothetical protein